MAQGNIAGYASLRSHGGAKPRRSPPGKPRLWQWLDLLYFAMLRTQAPPRRWSCADPTGKDAMVKSICFLACSLSIGQVVERGDWQLSPQLVRGQELVYTGTYLDESITPNVHYQKKYRLDTTL